MKRIYYSLFILLIVTSCFKEESAIEPYDRGDAIIKTISTGTNGDYSNQIFYDIGNNREVKVVDRTTWDLGFETTPTGTSIRLNTANKMQASKTGITNFSSIADITTMTLNYFWDRSGGSADSVALKDWIIAGVTTNEVFIVDLGETPALSLRGFKKLQVLGMTSTEFTIKYSNIDGSNEHTLLIPKDISKNQTCFSFAGNGKVVSIEPDAGDWDVLFSQYLHTFYDSDPVVSYSVNGVLLNPSNVKAAEVFDKEYASITIDDVSSYTLTNELDVIGYDWKLFDFDTQIYQVDPSKCYIIQDRNGFYFKLRFVDFYNIAGIKGYPKFEMKGL
ncbi:hypothetical protein N9544_03625 [Flavobacteriales bacterium]|nr:hypothetical protein [Flavobacteriales bacterium]